ncbi:MAG: hypothetical protein G01um101448_651 [Parcubacteria group bacterium Gr01-1014_48]|nr:MAG: hypothetical protein Greene041614_890 [Parcubacteria group bacterium Greene0416_14]TSC73661.1 MAG: hypothetical protein G01um101448_651 [Parcubacteria group bacterium Gr01-1014_48]TSD01103.1 MAG: hypothetical protein Greene101415_506 [Parcubacteria group bacterium Greene1014_15]TSD06891.1 MAG: hypothetical protein Greene07144_1088 [Parcubacteria group bacterium Greene0714_4]
MTQRVFMTTKKNLVRGFSLIELLVVMSIMLTLSTLILIRHNEFKIQLLLRSLSYEIALAIRQAQVYGLGLRELKGITDPFQIGYGVHFETASPTTFLLFADVDRNHQFVLADGDTVVQTYKLSHGSIISQLCQGNGINVGCGKTTLDIVYERPEPEAFINGDQSLSTATIQIKSLKGDVRYIAAWITGQILVQ